VIQQEQDGVVRIEKHLGGSVAGLARESLDLGALRKRLRR
jgi:hypothetical protein